MEDIFEHPIFKHKMKLPTIEKRLKSGIFAVFALRAEDDMERDVVKSTCELVEDFGERAGAIYLCAYKHCDIFGFGEAVKIATEMIYDLTYRNCYESIFSDGDKRSVKIWFSNMSSWIVYTGSRPVYEENSFQKRSMRTTNGTKNFKWFEKNVLSYLTVDERISLANMMILNCAKYSLTTSEEIASLHTRETIFNKYYPLCNKYKDASSKEQREKMKRLGERKEMA